MMSSALSMNAFEKTALALFASLLEDKGAGFDWTKLVVTERDPSPLGFLVELADPTMDKVKVLGDGITRHTLMVQHPQLANDGLLILLLDRLGRPIELEAVSFDESEWPKDSDVGLFVFGGKDEKAIET